MKVSRTADDKRRKKRSYALAIGVFDGVHIGHQALLHALIRRAAERHLHAAVYTFCEHPSIVLNPGQPKPMLLSNAGRLFALKRCGVPEVFLKDFTSGFARMRPEDFMGELMRWGDIRLLIVGFNFHFGFKGRGDGKTLADLGRETGCETIVLPAVNIEGNPVSSTRIRKAVADGDMALAQKLLGRPYALRGRIMTGKRVGSAIGFATANLQCEGRLLPRPGVYVTRAFLHGETYAAVTNVGYNPTVSKDLMMHVETHLFSGQRLPELYGAFLTIEFLQCLRDERAFESIGALRAQIACDVEQAQAYYRDEV